MKNVELSQDELKLLMELVSLAFDKGGLSTQGAAAILNLGVKMARFIDKDEIKTETLTVADAQKAAAEKTN